MTSQKSTNTTTKKANEKARRQRVPLSGPSRRLKLPEHLDRDLDFHYRWFNDTEDRIQRALAAGYEFVTKDMLKGEDVGDPDLHNQDSSPDSRVSKRLRDYEIFLMRQPTEYRTEDLAMKNEASDKVDEAVFGSDDKVPNSYGLDVKYHR